MKADFFSFVKIGDHVVRFFNQITTVQTGPAMTTFNNSLQVVPGKVRCFKHGEAGAEIGLKVEAEEVETDLGISSILPMLGSKDTSIFIWSYKSRIFSFLSASGINEFLSK